MNTGLLAGLRIVEIAHPLTEYAGLYLAGLGAEVLLIEPPDGAVTRQRNPRMPDSDRSSRGSIPFLARNLNKKSIVIDPDDSGALRELGELCSRANAVLDADGSVFHAVVKDSEAHAIVTVTDEHNLGVSSLVGFAASGGLSSCGWPDRPPCNAPSWLALDGAGVYAAVLVMVAEYARRKGTTNIRFEVPFEEAAVAAVTPWTRTLCSYEMQANGQGVVTARLGAHGFPTYEVKDGYVRILVGTPRQWQALVELLGSPEELVYGPWAEAQFRAENMDALFMMCSEYMRDRTMDDLFNNGQRLGLTISPVYTLEQFRADAHVRSRGIMIPVKDPEFGDMELVRPPLRTGSAHLNGTVSPAPALGDANSDLNGILSEDPLRIPEGAAGFDISSPLRGIRVLELGFGAVVPEAAALLASFGCEVLKLESGVHVDFLRQNGLAGFMDVDNSPTFNQLNLGAGSVAIDMTRPEGIEIAHRLAAASDIVMDNMRGSVARRWGLDYAGARELKEDIIYLSSQGLGSGPYEDYQTYGPNLQTFSGATSQWAHPDDPYPVGSSLNHPDHVAGKQALVAIIGALLRRDSDGEGCRIEAAQVESAAFMLGDRFLHQHVAGSSPKPIGNRSLDMAPHGCYLCLEEDRWVAIAVECDEQWSALCSLIQEEWTEDPVLDTTAGRLQRANQLDEQLGKWTGRRPLADVEDLLRGAGISVSRVRIGDDLAADPNLNRSGFFPTIEHPTAGHRQYTGIPVILEGYGRYPVRRPPLLGEQTERVLYDILGLKPEQVDDLTAREIVGH